MTSSRAWPISLCQSVQRDAAEALRIELDFVSVPYKIIETITVVAARDESLRLLCFRKLLDYIRPGGSIFRREAARRQLARMRLLLEIVALPLIKLVAGSFESPRKTLQLTGGGEVQAPLEQRSRDPDGCRQRDQCRGEKDEDQSIAKAVHPIPFRGRTACVAGPAGGTVRRFATRGFAGVRFAAENVDQAGQAHTRIAHDARTVPCGPPSAGRTGARTDGRAPYPWR